MVNSVRFIFFIQHLEPNQANNYIQKNSIQKSRGQNELVLPPIVKNQSADTTNINKRKQSSNELTNTELKQMFRFFMVQSQKKSDLLNRSLALLRKDFQTLRLDIKLNHEKQDRKYASLRSDYRLIRTDIGLIRKEIGFAKIDKGLPLKDILNQNKDPSRNQKYFSNTLANKSVASTQMQDNHSKNNANFLKSTLKSNQTSTSSKFPKSTLKTEKDKRQVPQSLILLGDVPNQQLHGEALFQSKVQNDQSTNAQNLHQEEGDGLNQEDVDEIVILDNCS
ncbi:hypothetical protein OXYTRIMIC_659 [Oxytricha trifallax]|uniref:Uncharacterized protein n=1 Tax=Oxytricha trifallax TaxID=1172189 RepID=A0A073HYY1_9SPIT|nr:hypothetical protein OXYTRIMIC_659 [Oxytricha trifallax]